MTPPIALLRVINVGGVKVSMANLKLCSSTSASRTVCTRQSDVPQQGKTGAVIPPCFGGVVERPPGDQDAGALGARTSQIRDSPAGF